MIEVLCACFHAAAGNTRGRVVADLATVADWLRSAISSNHHDPASEKCCCCYFARRLSRTVRGRGRLRRRRLADRQRQICDLTGRRRGHPRAAAAARPASIHLGNSDVGEHLRRQPSVTVIARGHLDLGDRGLCERQKQRTSPVVRRDTTS